MKNLFLKFGFLFLVGLSISSCKKDNDVAKNKVIKETPLRSIINESIVVDTSTTNINGSYELGYEFYASRNGKITKVGCMMPSKGTYRVSLWDFESKNLISSTSIQTVDSSSFYYNDISAVVIVANKRYMISLHNRSNGIGMKYYLFYKKSNTTHNSIYPFTNGSVSYVAFYEALSNTSVFPDMIIDTDQPYIVGIPDFQFVYDSN